MNQYRFVGSKMWPNSSMNANNAFKLSEAEESVTSIDIQSAMQSIFNTVFQRHDIVMHPGLTAADIPGWDSFQQVSLIMATEEHFKITFADAEIDAVKTVGDLLTAVVRKVGVEA